MLHYAITDGTGDAAMLARAAAHWSAAGIDFVQLREKRLSAGGLALVARRMIAAMGTRSRLLINGRVDVAAAAGAAGVHLTASPGELTVAQVRQVFPAAIVSVSCHTVAEASRAAAAGANLILFGPVFEKRVAERIVGAGLGLERLHRACAAAAGVPILALGGVTQATAAECLAAGAAGIAGIRLFSPR
jgi:thiamine-phosphate pyrophosphorylase